MALSETFLKQAQAIGDQVTDVEMRKQEREAHGKTRKKAGKNFLEKQAAPIFEVLAALAALPPDKDGFSFSYSSSYSQKDDSVELAIVGKYKDGNGKFKESHYHGYGTYQHRTSGFEIEASYDVWKNKLVFKGSPWDIDHDKDVEKSKNLKGAQKMVDGFLARWVGRNMPAAAGLLAGGKKPAAAPANKFLKNWQQTFG